MSCRFLPPFIIAQVLLAASATVAGAQSTAPAAAPAPAVAPATVDLANPIHLIQAAGDAVLRRGGDADGEAVSGSLTSTMSILILLTILSVAPALLVLCTSFTRIVVVLALLRQAIGTQSLPPSQVITGLGIFMTLLIMAPTFQEINRTAIVPLQDGQINELDAWGRAKIPLRTFMFRQIDYADNWSDVYMILNFRGIEKKPQDMKYGDVDMLTLIPAFVLSELKVAFLIGFRLYLPFLIIDMVIAGVLISMGMIMLPPVLISLPFKLLLFVLVDGWQLVAGNLLASFSIST